MIDMSVRWRPVRWWQWNRYEVGTVLTRTGDHSNVAIKLIAKHSDTGKLRVSTEDPGWPLDGAQIAVNGASPVTVKKAGRHGRLHLGMPGKLGGRAGT